MMLGAVLMLMIKLKAFPLPLLPMILRSLNLATLFFITWELFLSSPQKFSSLPILRFTIVPSSMSLSRTTLTPLNMITTFRHKPTYFEDNGEGLV